LSSREERKGGMKNRFGTTSSYTVGVEEEFQLVAPSTLQLAPAVEEVIGAVPDASDRLARELFQDCAFHCPKIRYARRHRERPPAPGLALGGHLQQDILAPGGENHRGATFGEEPRRRPADTA
jgi:hypothetical protein